MSRSLPSLALLAIHFPTPTDPYAGSQDAASYKITSTQPLELEECVPGEARFGGPVVLDGIFRTSIEDKLKLAAATANSVTAADVQNLYLELWETYIKPEFAGSDIPFEWVKPLPPVLIWRRPRKENGPGPTSAQMANQKPSDSRGNAFVFCQVYGLRIGMMADEPRRDELVQHFAPTVNKVVGLIRHQVNAVMERHKKLPKVCTGIVPL